MSSELVTRAAGDETVAGSADEASAPHRAPDADRPLPPGSRVGRYVILSRLGMGGMGVVYGAHDPDLDRKVALKLLHGGAAAGSHASDGHRRLLREAQAMAKVSHRNVITVHDVGEWQGRVYVAMELVVGVTLREWLREPRPWSEILGVFRGAGEGLAAAHQQGLVHRDFKPDNAMLGEDGVVRVMDFGLARALGSSAEPPAAASTTASSSSPAQTRARCARRSTPPRC